MKILSHDAYLDGGTIKLETNIGTYYVDNRIDTDTPNEVYDRYPDDKGASIVSTDIKAALTLALGEYHQSDYIKDILKGIK